MFKIDWKRWNEAVKAVEEHRVRLEEVRAEYAAGKLTWEQFREFNPFLDHKVELTKLYSIRAMARGRVHRKGSKLTAYAVSQLRGHEGVMALGGWGAFSAAGGTLRVELTAEDQAKFVGDTWKQYEAAQEVAA